MNLGGPHKLFQEYTKLAHACYAILAKDTFFCTCFLSICFEQINMTTVTVFIFISKKTLQQNKWHNGYE